VVEQVLPQVASVVYLDAFFPEDGQRGLDLQPEPGRSEILAAWERGEAGRPVPGPDMFGINAADREWVAGKLTPHPIAVGLQPIRLTGARERVAKKTYIRATGSARAQYDAYRARFAADPSWRVYDVPCGHDVMIDMPERLTEILLEVA
jgi:hypothetical protein